ISHCSAADTAAGTGAAAPPAFVDAAAAVPAAVGTAIAAVARGRGKGARGFAPTRVRGGIPPVTSRGTRGWRAEAVIEYTIKKHIIKSIRYIHSALTKHIHTRRDDAACGGTSLTAAAHGKQHAYVSPEQNSAQPDEHVPEKPGQLQHHSSFVAFVPHAVQMPQ